MPISSALGSSALLPAGLGFRNVLINGDMRIAQRGTSFTIPSGGGNNYFAADRWRTRDYTWSAGVNPTVSNETTIVPTGFTNSYKWANGSPALTFASGGSMGIAQTIEGYQAASLYGKSCYLSFWVRSSTAGKYTILFSNGAFTRTLLKTYTVDSPNTWEYKTIPIDMVSAVSSGVWEKTTSAGLGMQFMLGTHADRTGNSNLDAWGDRVFYHYATTDSVNLATIPNSTFYLTGVQLEANYQPTPFEQRPYGVELQLCQRYYWQADTFQIPCLMQSGFDNKIYAPVTFFNGVAMRATPTAAITSTPYVTDMVSNIRNITSVSIVTKMVTFSYDSTKLTSLASYAANFNDTGRTLSLSSEL